MKKLALVTALLLSGGSVQAAESVRWDNMSVSYESVELDDLTFTGFSLSGTKLVAENVFISASYGSVSDDIDVMGTKVDLDLDSFSIGAGYRHGLAKSTDVFGVFSFEDSKAKASSGNVSESDGGNGFGLETGIRSLVTEQVELMGSLKYVAISDDSETAINVTALYHFTNQFSAGVGYSTTDDVDSISVSVVWFY